MVSLITRNAIKTLRGTKLRIPILRSNGIAANYLHNAHSVKSVSDHFRPFGHLSQSIVGLDQMVAKKLTYQSAGFYAAF